MPLCNSHELGSIDVTLTRRSTDEQLRFGGLLIHLIEAPEFCEGSVPYRLDPEQTVRFM